ncbi:hypothetical protein N0V88_008010 [Collariella sp. IMI 366227]|nr:hypothetical protein N0V88_008010 [Collariella sp. IMI 366227]
MRRLKEHTLGEPYTIRDALELYNLSTWGFVLFRCTYSSQEKWDKFLARVQGDTRKIFEKARLMDVYARMRWTIFEDAAALDGADILETTRRFVEWVDRGPGGQELVGSVFGTTMAKTRTPRHNFFFHVDEESLESVVDDEKVAKAYKEGREPFCRMVMAHALDLDAITIDRERGVYCENGRELEESEVEEFSKRVMVDCLVPLYAVLSVELYAWCCLVSFEQGPPYIFMH